jgi:polar amino acid transport system substrate-binding protein
MTTQARRAAALLAALALGAAGVTGCGSSSGGGATSSGAGATAGGPADAAVAKLVPPAVKQSGKLTVATDPTYAPDEFVGKDGHTIVGFDVDLANALAGKMGLRAQIVDSTFDSIIPGLASKKYDLGISSHNDTKAREKVVDFVTYFSAGSSFYVKAQGGPNVNGLADLCGHRVAAEKGTTQADDAAAQAKRCAAEGKPALNAMIFPDQNGANLALSSGRADVAMADTPVAAYIVKQSSGQFKVVGQPYATAPHGIAIPKGSGLDRPVLQALKALMADGEYQRILSKWGVSGIAIRDPKINGAVS